VTRFSAKSTAGSSRVIQGVESVGFISAEEAAVNLSAGTTQISAPRYRFIVFRMCCLFARDPAELTELLQNANRKNQYHSAQDKF
jgi:hypothetical protein